MSTFGRTRTPALRSTRWRWEARPSRQRWRPGTWPCSHTTPSEPRRQSRCWRSTRRETDDVAVGILDGVGVVVSRGVRHRTRAAAAIRTARRNRRGYGCRSTEPWLGKPATGSVQRSKRTTSVVSQKVSCRARRRMMSPYGQSGSLAAGWGEEKYRSRGPEKLRGSIHVEPTIECVPHEFGRGRDPESLHHLVIVAFDGSSRQPQVRSDFLHALAFDDQSQDVALAGGQLWCLRFEGLAMRSMTSFVMTGVM